MMVISYTIPQLYAIGETMTITELLARGKLGMSEISDYDSKINQSTDSFIKTIQQLIGTQVNQIRGGGGGQVDQIDESSEPSSSEVDSSQQEAQSTTTSVAEFFKKAQQNFYPQASKIDPTKVRRLSEIEAELLGSIRSDSSS